MHYTLHHALETHLFCSSTTTLLWEACTSMQHRGILNSHFSNIHEKKRNTDYISDFLAFFIPGVIHRIIGASFCQVPYHPSLNFKNIPIPMLRRSVLAVICTLLTFKRMTFPGSLWHLHLSWAKTPRKTSLIHALLFLHLNNCHTMISFRSPASV